MLYGAIRANEWLLLISFVFIAHFFYSYYNYCYKSGFKIDFWHFNIFLFYVLPIHIIYPFAASDFNVISTGSSILLIQEYVDEAYVVSTIGYIFTYVGFYFLNTNSSKEIIYRLTSKLSLFFEKIVNTIIRDKYIMIILSSFLVIFTVIGLIYAISFFGLTFNLRSAFYADESILKSFFNLWTALFTNISGFILIRYLYKKEFFFIVIYIFTSLFAIFSGTRSTIIFPFLNSFLFYLISRKLHLNLRQLFLTGAISLFLIFALERLRREDSSANSITFIYSFFYGNSFSDVRDFAWILAYWDGNTLDGKSYLSAFMSFIPRSLSDFRSVYAFGVYTDNMIGFDPATHPGLRPGRFGEIYLNFGILGVILLGFIGGYVMRLADLKVKKISNLDPNNYVSMFSATFLTFLISQFYITAGFWALYVLVVIFITSLLFKSLITPLKIKAS